MNLIAKMFQTEKEKNSESEATIYQQRLSFKCRITTV
jgi:hypothetical protein